jgi:iron complex outermembrane receptor protein
MNATLKQMWHGVVVVSLLCYCAPIACAETQGEKGPALLLPAIVITPSRMDMTSLHVPGAVSVVTEEDIKTSNAQTVTDILRTATGVIVRDELGNGKAATVDMRGFGETSRLNVLVLIDGRRVNNIDLSGTDWTQIPLDQVEKIEISRGPGSVLYGDNAVAGVINIITKKGEGPLSIGASSYYGSYDHRAWQGEASGSVKGLSYSFNASYADNNGYRENNELRTQDIAGRLSYAFDDIMTLYVNSGYHQDHYGLPGALFVSDLATMSRRDAKYPLDTVDIDDYYVTTGSEIKLNVAGRDWGKVITDVSFRQRDMDTITFNALYETDADTRVWTVSPRYVFNAEFWEHFANDLVIGYDYFLADHDIHGGMVGGSKEDIEITKRTVGLYGLDDLTLFDTVALQLGYRYEWAKYRFYQIHGAFGALHNDQVRRVEEGVFTSGISYYLTEHTNLYGSYAQSYRLPATDEFYASLPWGTGLNTELQPQEADHYELGVKHYYQDIVFVGGNFFHIDVEDEIYYDPFTFTNANYDKTEHTGLELEAKAQPIDTLSVFANYTYTRPRFEGGAYDGNHIPLVPKHNVSLGGSYEIIDGLTFSAVSNYVGSRYKLSDLNNIAPKAKPYFVTDAKLSYAYKGFEVTGGINNVFDEQYAELEGFTSMNQEYLYPSPERNYFASIRYKY